MLREDNRAKGIACIIASAFGFALMALCVRLCDDFGAALSCFQKGFFRNAVAFLLAAIVFARVARQRHGLPRLEKAAILPLSARCLFGSLGIFANFYALSHIPIGEAMTLNKTAPFFTVLFAWLLMGERATARQLLCLILAFAGAALVMRPGFRPGETFATLAALTGGLGAGIAYVNVHRLGRIGTDGTLIVLVFSAFSCLVSLPFIAFDFRPMTFPQVLILLGAGIGAAIGQFGVTAAYRYAEPRAIAAYDYTNILFTALFGFLAFGQVPDALSIVGFLLILASALRLRK